VREERKRPFERTENVRLVPIRGQGSIKGKRGKVKERMGVLSATWKPTPERIRKHQPFIAWQRLQHEGRELGGWNGGGVIPLEGEVGEEGTPKRGGLAAVSKSVQTIRKKQQPWGRGGVNMYLRIPRPRDHDLKECAFR